MSNKIPQYLKLKDNHPTMIKLMKLYDLAEELGISLSFVNHTFFVEDRDRDLNLPVLRMEDIDNGEGVGDFPPSTEFKVIYQNPAWLKQRNEEQKERWKKENDERLAKEKALKLEQQKKEERLAKEKEARERKLLLELKNKYPEEK